MTEPPSQAASPAGMRAAMAEYIRTVHQAYLSASVGQPPAVQGRMPLLAGPFTVIAAGVQNLHVIATTDRLPPPSGQQVAVDEELDRLQWTLRFYDPVVLPQLGMIDENSGAAGSMVRRTLGLSTHLYHLIVLPGSQLTPHHAGHAGAGLAMDHVAGARDFESIRSAARGKEVLVDEMEGAAHAGLIHAQVLLARVIAPDSPEVRTLSQSTAPDPVALRRALLGAVREARLG